MKTKFALSVALLCSLASLLAAPRTNEQPPTPLVTQPEAHWIAVLQSNADRHEKTTACHQLAVIGTKSAVPVLVSLLANPEMNHMARYALETMPGSGVDAALRDQLTALKGLPLAGVIATVGVRQDAKAVKLIAPLLQDPDAHVSQVAARALGDIGTTSSAAALREAFPAATPANLPSLYEGWMRCADRLARSKPKEARRMYDELLAMKNLPGHIRGAAVHGAIFLRGKGDLDLLATSLLNPDGEVFVASLRASSEVPGSQVTRVLESALNQCAADRQTVIIQTLGLRGDAGAIPTLTKVAKGSGQPPVREAAVRALTSIGKPSLTILFDLAQTSDAAIARPAQDGLAGIPGPDADALVLKLAQLPNCKTAGIELIGRRRMTSALPVLVKSLSDSDPNVRAAALPRLGDLAGASEVPPLLSFMRETKDVQQLEAAAEALGSICARADRPEPAVSQVAAAFQNADPDHTAALLKTAATIGGPKMLAAARQTLSDSNPQVRRAAVRALADWPDASASADLLKVAASATAPAEHSLAFRGYIRLAQNSTLSPAQKLEMLSGAAKNARNVEEKKLLLAALGDVATDSSLRLVAGYLSVPELTEDAAAAAVRIATKLDEGHKADIVPVLDEVLRSAKSDAVLDKARTRKRQLTR